MTYTNLDRKYRRFVGTPNMLQDSVTSIGCALYNPNLFLLV